MELKDITGIGEKTQAVLEKNNLTTISALLHHFPRTYRTYHSTLVRDAQLGDWVSIVGTITRPISKHGAHVTTQLATFKDNSGSLTLRWFNSPFITRSVNPGVTYLVRGQLTIFGNTRQIVAPQIKSVGEGFLPPADEMMPIYPSLGSLKSGNLRKIIHSALDSIPPIPDPLDVRIRVKHNLIDLDTAIRIVHRPPSGPGPEGLKAAIHRLAFDELYTLQLESLSNSELHKVKTTPLQWSNDLIVNWFNHLPYTPTGAQTRVIHEILTDLQKPIAMHRLLAGEVGSGKTLVAAAAALASHLSGHQTLVMAPTQILAEQLYASFKNFMGSTLKVSLITASEKGDPLADLVVGTQALLSGKIKFSKKVGLVIVDEQHKFGVKQREYLSSMTPAPHVLMLTATPIPRTLAMTIFSNMDISRLDELPSSRLPIKTYLVGEEKRDRAFAWIKSEVTTNHNQAFVVVPLIEEAEDDEGNAKKSLKLLETDLKKRFPGLAIDIMHGKMKEVEKTEHLRAFRDGITQILVATSMVEVGIDIPGANIMVIEDAERFGLAQLHQLRGRVGRGNAQGHCLIFSASSSPSATSRLNFFKNESNGEKLAMFDLDNRGPGELFGESQHGFFSLHFASIYDTQLLKSTRDAALSLRGQSSQA
ncbi:MAG: ATP-dependent DNA helicase RecG [Microgenomates group bacterium]